MKEPVGLTRLAGKRPDGLTLPDLRSFPVGRNRSPTTVSCRPFVRCSSVFRRGPFSAADEKFNPTISGSSHIVQSSAISATSFSKYGSVDKTCAPATK